MSSDKKIQKELKDILSFNNEDEKLKFEIDMIHMDTMNMVADLMEKLPTPMKPSELAKELGVSPSYVSQLFSGDKLINYSTLAKLQRIFNVRFKLNIKSKEVRKNAEQGYIIIIQRNKVSANNNTEISDSPIPFIDQIHPNYC